MDKQEIMRRAREAAAQAGYFAPHEMGTLHAGLCDHWSVVKAARIALESIDTPCPDPWEKAVEAFWDGWWPGDREQLEYGSNKDRVRVGLKAAREHMPKEDQ